jgi:hypothetical protein
MDEGLFSIINGFSPAGSCCLNLVVWFIPSTGQLSSHPAQQAIKLSSDNPKLPPYVHLQQGQHGQRHHH